MKIKALSLLIAICMVVGMVPAVSAAGIEDYPALTYGVEMTIECNETVVTYVTFTPETSGIYRFYSLGDLHCYAELYTERMGFIDSSSSCYHGEEHGHADGRNFCFIEKLNAGATYILGVELISGEPAEVTVGVGHAHTYTEEVIKSPTCSEEGSALCTCDECGYTYTRVLYTTAHSYAPAVTKEPTCTEDGVLTHTCTVCGSSYDKEIPLLGHVCDENLRCTRCGIDHPTSGVWEGDGEWTSDSVSWTFVDGLLIVTGEGEMPWRESRYDDDWNIIGYDPAPWQALPITEVVIGKGITRISQAAFLGLDKLEKVTLPGTLTWIWDQAFSGCSALTAIELPEGLERIGSGAFRGTALREVYIPVSYNDDWNIISAFSGAAELERIIVAPENTVMTSDSQGVVYSKDMTEMLAFPDGYKGEYTLPASVTSVPGGEMFSDCAKLEAFHVAEGNEAYYSVDGMFYESFYDYKHNSETGQWEEVYIGEQLILCPPAKQVGSYHIEDWVASVENTAFNNCRYLTELTIPVGCTNLNPGSMFGGCTALENVWFEEGHPVYSSKDDGLVYNGEKYHEYKSGYYSEEELKSFGVGGLLCWVPPCRSGLLEIPEGVKAMAGGAIKNTKLSAVRFPSTFTSFFVYAVNGEENNLKWVLFTGEKPDLWTYDAGEDCTLHNVDATIYYPGWLESWSEPELASCGSEDLTYIPYEQGKEPVWGAEEPEKPENPFTDVPAGSFYAEPVAWAVENGITTGASENSFNPDGQCLRAHVVTFLWRAEGCPEPRSLDNPFVDVKASDFYFKAVLWAVENKITNGSDATHFNPLGVCNRAQVVTFLHRAKGSPAPASLELPFTDVPAGTWYAEPIAWAVEKGVTNGLSTTQFGPNAACNRAQVVTFLYRAYVPA